MPALALRVGRAFLWTRPIWVTQVGPAIARGTTSTVGAMAGLAERRGGARPSEWKGDDAQVAVTHIAFRTEVGRVAEYGTAGSRSVADKR